MAASMEYVKCVSDIFDINKFKEFQTRAIDALMDSKDVYLSVKTGGGKSLVYQAFPSIYRQMKDEPCRVIVVSPLISIMKEQCDFLNSLNISATYIGKDSDENTNILEGKFSFVFTSPESLLGIERWRSMLISSTDVRLLVVDEAHTVLQWGSSQRGDDPFRSWYGKLGEVRSLIDCPLLLITATANSSSRKEMLRKFSMTNFTEIIENPDRTNIKLFVQKFKSNTDIRDTMYFLIENVRVKKIECERYIVFCQSIKTCGEVYTSFRMEIGNSDHIEMYHSKTSEDLKGEIRKDMATKEGRIRVLIATSAAGMGVNFVDIRNVIHYGPTNDMDSYIQQIGRAGRDTEDTTMAMLFYSGQQCRKLDSDMDSYVKNSEKCRRGLMLSGYNASPIATRIRHLCCDVCDKLCECKQDDCSSFKHPYEEIEIPKFSSSSDSENEIFDNEFEEV